MGADQTTSQPPPPPREGRLVISYLNELYRWIKKNQVIAGVGLLATQIDSGKIIRAVDQRIEPPHPFQIVPTGGLNFTIREGYIYGVTNDTYDLGVAIPLTIAESNRTATDNNTVTVCIDISYAWKGQTDFGFMPDNHLALVITGATVRLTTSAPPANPNFPPEPDALTTVIVGSVTALNGQITTHSNEFKSHYFDTVSGAWRYIPE